MASLAQTDWEDQKPERDDIAQWPDLGEAEAVLLELASIFGGVTPTSPSEPGRAAQTKETDASNLEAKYRALLEQVAKLPERQRDAISLRHSGLSFEEVGQLLRCSEDAAKMLYHRAVKAVKESAAKEGV